MARKTLVTNWVHPEVLDLLRTRGPVEANNTREPWPRHELLSRAREADAMIAFMTDHVDDAFLAQCPELRVIACALKGADNFDLAACRRSGVAVSIVPDLLTAPTAELTVGLMISLGRNLLQGDRTIREGSFAGWRPILYGTGLDGASVGIIGIGAVGQAIAHRLRAFRCRLSYFDVRPLSPAKEDGSGLMRRDLPQLLSESDYVVLALPLGENSVHIINAETIAQMKPGALLINPARGSLVDESAAADALEAGHLGGYAADVFELEDWAQTNRPARIEPRLLGHPRTILTPHLGSAVDLVRRDIALAAARDILRFLDGAPLQGGVVDPRQIQTDSAVR
ncbi:MAG: phosphonate dehydrogenase [Afipia broomeae]|jgi:phosphonate dehydrogenase|uniref:Hydroxyacid dehydrogenase n=1 Tax=Candidatus Afipia apatlaquensis TaxID=2712852 RepID=A0A7C9RFR2_9BRAD|nr:hydroxyacid dehydrogenase [Afipia sp.]NGX96304.1 hydroxyacid dehydrogenase [Candidatus Afipia apatlaquensis]RTL78539.1 MAG: hydroxyacid dehydrogenase [Bradyrhizobiaceae bacterium]